MDVLLPRIGVTFGALACLLVVTQLAWATARASLGSLRSRRRLRADRQTLRQRIEATARAARAVKSVTAWQGWRQLRVGAVVDEAWDVKSYYLNSLDGRPLPRFEPGQYLTFRVRRGGDESPLVRCYSLSDRPREDYYRCTVKRIASSEKDGKLPGRVSTHFHVFLEVGDLVEVKAPRGEFFLDPLDTRPVVLIAGGIGITPLLSMLNSVLQGSRKQEIYLFYGVHNRRGHPFKEHLETLAKEHPNFHLHICYSSPMQSDRQHVDYQHAGHVTLDLLRDVLPSNNFPFYICGPAGMMEFLVPALVAWGVPETDVHFEAFGPASVKRTLRASEPLETTAPCEVRFARSGRTLTWDGSTTSLLELAESQGIALEYGCRAGNCGQCLTAVKDGTFRTIKTPGLPVEPNHCLTCVSVPTGPLTLDA